MKPCKADIKVILHCTLANIYKNYTQNEMSQSQPNSPKTIYAFRNYMHYLDFCTHIVIKCDQFTCTASFIKWSGALKTIYDV